MNNNQQKEDEMSKTKSVEERISEAWCRGWLLGVLVGAACGMSIILHLLSAGAA